MIGFDFILQKVCEFHGRLTPTDFIVTGLGRDQVTDYSSFGSGRR